ncbi:MAG: SPOR domain-containing protein [Syntrophobacteraceae bacterium]|nr:SPOR domain-containing protein [Syntrophobacteraceae bacterium]
MQKKIFLPKGLPTGRSFFVRWLLIASVGLILLILLTPLILTRSKGPREISRKPIPNRGERSMVVREIPKAPPPFLSDLPHQGAPSAETTPPASPSPFKNTQESSDNKTPSSQQSPVAAPGSATDRTSAPPSSEPTRAVQEGGVPQEAAPQPKTALSTPASQPMQPAPPPPASRKTESRGGTRLFTVQLGSFKERHNAEELKETFTKKGYSVVVKPLNHPTLGPLFVVQLEPVSDERKANTLMAQIRQESKIKPVIVRVAPGQ